MRSTRVGRVGAQLMGPSAQPQCTVAAAAVAQHAIGAAGAVHCSLQLRSRKPTGLGTPRRQPRKGTEWQGKAIIAVTHHCALLACVRLDHSRHETSASDRRYGPSTAKYGRSCVGGVAELNSM